MQFRRQACGTNCCWQRACISLRSRAAINETWTTVGRRKSRQQSPCERKNHIKLPDTGFIDDPPTIITLQVQLECQWPPSLFIYGICLSSPILLRCLNTTCLTSRSSFWPEQLCTLLINRGTAKLSGILCHRLSTPDTLQQRMILSQGRRNQSPFSAMTKRSVTVARRPSPAVPPFPLVPGLRSITRDGGQGKGPFEYLDRPLNDVDHRKLIAAIISTLLPGAFWLLRLVSLAKVPIRWGHSIWRRFTWPILFLLPTYVSHTDLNMHKSD